MMQLQLRVFLLQKYCNRLPRIAKRRFTHKTPTLTTELSEQLVNCSLRGLNSRPRAYFVWLCRAGLLKTEKFFVHKGRDLKLNLEKVRILRRHQYSTYVYVVATSPLLDNGNRQVAGSNTAILIQRFREKTFYTAFICPPPQLRRSPIQNGAN